METNRTNGNVSRNGNFIFSDSRTKAIFEAIPDYSKESGFNEAIANADYLVKCVNSHDELVKALSDIVNLQFEAGKSRTYIENIIRIAKKALYTI